MNIKDLRDIGIALVLAAAMCSMLFGCGEGSSSGGVGGQGYAFKDIHTGGGPFSVTITNTDGGTFTDPSVAVQREPTTQPSE